MIEVLLILGALALVAACGAFVAAEFSFVTVDRAAVDRAAERGDRAPTACRARCARSRPAVRRAGRHHRHEPADRLPGRAGDRAADRRAARGGGVPEGAVPGVALAIALVLATG